MKLFLRSLGVVVPLLGVLTWLSLHSAGPLGQDYVFAQRDVARVSLAEAAMQADVLQARAGLLRNYDPLVNDMDALEAAAQELHRQAMVRTEDTPVLDELLRLVAADAAVVERFKTDNALLQNSLSYFDVLDTRVAHASSSPALAATVVALGDAAFHLDRNATAEAREAMRKQLTALATFIPAGDGPMQGGDLSLLLMHGRLLARLLPAVDDDLSDLLSISTYDLRQVVRSSQDARRLSEEARASRYRVMLYLVAALLVVVLARVGLQWRASLHQLQRRTEAEATLASISARLSSATVKAFPSELSAVLETLGQAFGADHAYLLLDRLPPHTRLWTRPGAPELAESLAPVLAASNAIPDDVNAVCGLAKLPSGSLRTAIERTGARDWCASLLSFDNRRQGLLAFDLVGDANPWPSAGGGLIRVAGEVVQGAIQRHLAALQQAELEARLDRGRRLEALGTFASGIAHNFNNVLGAMMGHAEMAAETVPAADVSSRHIAEIQEAGHRAQNLVARILDFGSRRATQHRMLAIDTLLAESVSLLRPLIPREVELVVEPDAPGEAVDGDPVQLQQVLVNLGRNAAQAMPQGGRVTITATVEQLDATMAFSHGQLDAGRYVRVRVADTGVGMNAATLANLFRPFFTTKPAGTGLGLATVREIVHDHRGAIDVRSSSRQGSVFAVWLPVCTREPDQDAASEPLSRSVLLFAPDRATVLHDEDVLAALGYEPVGFDDPDEALSVAEATPDQFDAVLVNVLQPDEEALDLIGQLKRRLPDKPMILLTNDSADRSSPLLAGLGLEGVLQRPLRSPAVAGLLADVCARAP